MNKTDSTRCVHDISKERSLSVKKQTIKQQEIWHSWVCMRKAAVWLIIEKAGNEYYSDWWSMSVRPGTHWQQSWVWHGRVCHIRQSRLNVEMTFDIGATKVTDFNEVDRVEHVQLWRQFDFVASLYGELHARNDDDDRVYYNYVFSTSYCPDVLCLHRHLTPMVHTA